MNVHDKNIAKLEQIVGIVKEYWNDLTTEQVVKIDKALDGLIDLIEGRLADVADARHDEVDTLPEV